MYRWYKNAEVCYAYLEDVSTEKKPTLATFPKSNWFKRGWTLQELIAPRTVMFYANGWHKIGSKTDPDLESLISKTTGIDLKVLRDGDLETVSVAQRMSWVAKRKTTRIEDKAYSLMGLFDVNMPLLYGEGGMKSFIRLQEEIMKGSDDHSLFAWSELEEGNSAPYRGLLASSPALFAQSPSIIPYCNWNSTPYSMTNKGLHIELLLLPHDKTDDIFLAALDCKLDQETDICPAIYLKCFSAPGNQFCRIKPGIVEKLRHSEAEKRGKLSYIYVRQSILIPKPHNIMGLREIRITCRPESFSLIEVYPPECGTSLTGILRLETHAGKAIGLYENRYISLRFAIVVSFTPAGYCLFKVTSYPQGMTSQELYDSYEPRQWSSNFGNEIDRLYIGTKMTWSGSEEWVVRAEANTEKRHGMEGLVLALLCNAVKDMSSVD
jgi:hypothetical protein